MEQRNRGFKWIRENHGLSDTRNGVVYFGDDDNGYDVKLFEEVSPSSLSYHTSEVGMLEMTFLTSLGLTPSQLEAKARDSKEVERERRECNIIIFQIYVWHVKTEKPKRQDH